MERSRLYGAQALLIKFMHLLGIDQGGFVSCYRLSVIKVSIVN